MASQDSSTPVSEKWSCCKHPDRGSIDFTVEIPKKYTSESGQEMSFASLVHTIFWECPEGWHAPDKQWETNSLEFNWSEARDAQARLKAVMEEYTLTESGGRETDELKEPCYALDIYASATPTFDLDKQFSDHGVTGYYMGPDKKTPLSFYFEITEYGPPKPPDVTIAYGYQGYIDPRTPRRYPNIWSISSDTSEQVPSLNSATQTSESSYSLRSPGGSVMTDDRKSEDRLRLARGAKSPGSKTRAPPTDVQD